MQNKRFDVRAFGLVIHLGWPVCKALETLHSPKWIFVSTTCKASHQDDYGLTFCLNDFPAPPSRLKPSLTSTYFTSFQPIWLL
jgi:hypothetical protein